jgi:hypothetical protein
MQALRNVSIASVDLAFTSYIPLDFGTTGSLTSFFLDQGVFDMYEIAQNCAEFESASNSFSALAGGRGGGSSSDSSGARAQPTLPLNLLSQQCAGGVVARSSSVADINARLYCTNLDAAGRDAVRRSCVHPATASAAMQRSKC